MKSKRTFDNYKSIGAKFRLVRTILIELECEVCHQFNVKMSGKIAGTVYKLEGIRDELERIMHDEFPNDGILREGDYDKDDVFHGRFSEEDVNDLDKEVKDIARKYIKEELFNGNFDEPENKE